MLKMIDNECRQWLDKLKRGEININRDIVSETDLSKVINLSQLDLDEAFNKYLEDEIWKHRNWTELEQDVYLTIVNKPGEITRRDDYISYRRYMAVMLFLNKVDAQDWCNTLNSYLRPQSMGFCVQDDDMAIPRGNLDDRASIVTLSPSVFQMMINYIERKKKALNA